MPTTTWKLIFIQIFTGALLYAQTPVKIALFDTPIGNNHGDQIQNFLEKKIKKCRSCSLLRYDIFESNGKVDTQKFLSHLKNLPTDVNILHLSWNVPYESKYDLIINELKNRILGGLIVVAASGESQDPSEINLELKETVMGRVSGAKLIGELNKKGRLNINAYYGPEIMKSYPTVKGHSGSSFTSLLETAKIALELSRKTQK